MTRLARILPVLMLALSLVVSGYGSAVARGMSPASGQMELCIGASSVVVFVDEDGQPTAAPHLCPDCVLHFTGTLPTVAGASADLPHHRAAHPAPAVLAIAPHDLHAASARGPPGSV